MTLELSPEITARVEAAAKRAGSAPQQVVTELIVEHFPPPGSQSSFDPTLALLEEWRREDAQMSEEEVLQEREFWKEFESSINDERRAAGMRELW